MCKQFIRMCVNQVTTKPSEIKLSEWPLGGLKGYLTFSRFFYIIFTFSMHSMHLSIIRNSTSYKNLNLMCGHTHIYYNDRKLKITIFNNICVGQKSRARSYIFLSFFLLPIIEHFVLILDGKILM